MGKNQTTNKGTVLAGYAGKINELCAEYGKVLEKNNAKRMAEIDNELKENEAAYAALSQSIVFDELKNEDQPIRAAIVRYSYPTIRHKRIMSEDHKLKGYEPEASTKQIDLARMCDYLKELGLDFNSNWRFKVERFNQLLALRAATELGYTKAQIKTVCDSYYMSEASKSIDLGGTPTSNTQLCKQLQAVIDDIYMEANEKGKNSVACNSHDVAYLLMTYTRKGRNALSVRLSRHGEMNKTIMDVMHRILTGKVYDLEYKMVKDKTAGKSKPVESVKSEESAPVESEENATAEEVAA